MIAPKKRRQVKKPAPRSNIAVNLQRVKFVDEYIVNGHDVAGASGKAGVSARHGYDMLKDPRVLELLEQRSRAVAREGGMNAANWATELSAVAFTNIGDVFAPDGRPLPPWELPEHTKRAVKSVKMSEGTIKPNGERSGGTFEYRMHDKIAALEAMAKHLGLFERDNTQKQPPDVVIKVNLV